MPKTKISEFSATPGNNTDIDGINIAEGCAPSGINDAIRELMSQLKDWQAGTSNDPMVIGSSGSLTLSYGTANGVPYLNGSKVLTTGSALTFDGTNLVTTGYAAGSGLRSLGGNAVRFYNAANANWSQISAPAGTGDMQFDTGAGEQMRLTSTGLGIGTSSPGAKLHVVGGTQIQSSSSQALNLNAGTDTLNTIYGITFSTPTYSGGIAAIRAQRTGAQDAGALTFWTSPNGDLPNLRATLDSAGNLGLGVTPSAWGTTNSSRSLELNAGSVWSFSTSDFNFLNNAFYNGSNFIYKTSTGATRYLMDAGDRAHKWYTAPSGTAGNAISFTQAMTLTAAGGLNVGATTDPGAGNIRGTGLNGWTSIGDGVVATSRSDGMYLIQQANAAMLFYTNNTERARIDSSGNLLVGTQSTPNGGSVYYVAGGGTILTTQTTVSTACNHIVFRNSNGNVGSIQTSGSSTSFNTSSDYRLKENIQPMTGALAKVQALKPCTYNWKADGSEGEGFIAHELAEVVPQCVTGEKDAVDAEGKPVYQGIDTSFLVATLAAAIQEQQAMIQQLQAEVAALKGN